MKKISLLMVLLIITVAIAACGATGEKVGKVPSASAPTPAPTANPFLQATVQPAAAPAVVTVVVTATPVPGAELPAAEPTLQPEPEPTAGVPAPTPGTTRESPRLIAEIWYNNQTIPDQIYTPQVGDGGSCWNKKDPGIGVQAAIKVKLYEGAAFAADADAILVGKQLLGKQNDPADVIVFADSPGNYAFTGYSFGLCVANSQKPPAGKADKVFNDRDYSGDKRPAYWLGPKGEVVKTR